MRRAYHWSADDVRVVGQALAGLAGRGFGAFQAYAAALEAALRDARDLAKEVRAVTDAQRLARGRRQKVQCQNSTVSAQNSTRQKLLAASRRVSRIRCQQWPSRRTLKP